MPNVEIQSTRQPSNNTGGETGKLKLYSAAEFGDNGVRTERSRIPLHFFGRLALASRLNSPAHGQFHPSHQRQTSEISRTGSGSFSGWFCCVLQVLAAVCCCVLTHSCLDVVSSRNGRPTRTNKPPEVRNDPKGAVCGRKESNGGKIKEKMEIFVFCEWKLEVDREDEWTGSTGRERAVVFHFV